MLTVGDSEMNEFTHAVADALATLLGWSVDSIDRNALNQQLEEHLLRPFYDIHVEEDMPNNCPECARSHGPHYRGPCNH